MNRVITTAKSWEQLQDHCKLISTTNMRQLFAEDPERFDRFSLQLEGLFLDYSKNLITPEILKLLLHLTDEVKLFEKIESMFNGAEINTTERRPVLHTALRDPNGESLVVDGEDIFPQIQATLNKMEVCSNRIRSGEWLGYSGKPITDVVNLGIGGSDLGPNMVVEGLIPYCSSKVKCHFVSNVDGTQISETLKNLDPETTLFIIASKTFTTQETLTNALSAREWLEQKATKKNSINKHLLAVSANPKRAVEFGILEENVFPFWDWVGGRFSLWSAIGLSIAIAIGMDNFRKLLAGAHAMDLHFRNATAAKNMPIILALLGIWNTDFLNLSTQAVLPYDQYLHLLPSYLQQLEMESNGKHIRLDGSATAYATAPVLWGSVGTNGQHAFHQLLMQGTQKIPVDFVIPLETHNQIGEHHLLLCANCLAQSSALMHGRNEEEVLEEMLAQGVDEQEAKRLAPHKVILGNVPNNVILIDKVTPYSLGMLIALYEHKVFVQGVIWGVNSFDQWGVELGKKIAKTLVPVLQGDIDKHNLDCSTSGLVKKFIQSATPASKSAGKK